MIKLLQIGFFICLLSIEYLATTSVSIVLVENSWDKANHFIAFFVLYILLDFGFKIFTTLGKVSLLVLFAVQIEIVQYFMPNRYFSLLDVFADGIGILIAIGVMAFYNKYIKVKDTSYNRI
ncbi:MAG: VanZ family protein [Arcobacteraceae bacterium]